MKNKGRKKKKEKKKKSIPSGFEAITRMCEGEGFDYRRQQGIIKAVRGIELRIDTSNITNVTHKSPRLI